jgi:hypothetical protein
VFTHISELPMAIVVRKLLKRIPKFIAPIITSWFSSDEFDSLNFYFHPSWQALKGSSATYTMRGYKVVFMFSLIELYQAKFSRKLPLRQLNFKWWPSWLMCNYILLDLVNFNALSKTYIKLSTYHFAHLTTYTCCRCIHWNSNSIHSFIGLRLKLTSRQARANEIKSISRLKWISIFTWCSLCVVNESISTWKRQYKGNQWKIE